MWATEFLVSWGQKNEHNFPFCVVLCLLVLLRGSTQQKGERKNNLCALPSFLSPPPPPNVHSVTSRSLLNGQKWPWGWREPHRQTDHSVEMFVQQRGRKRGRKKEGARTTWVSASPCLPSLPLPLLWQRVTIQPEPVTKMSSVCLEKRSQSLHGSSSALRLPCNWRPHNNRHYTDTKVKRPLTLQTLSKSKNL